MPVYPTLRYADARAAIEWLEAAFGFPAKVVYDDADGTVAHAEIAAGDGLVMLGSERDAANARSGPPAGGGWLYVSVGNTDALHARAVSAGAEIVRPLEDTDYGSRDFAARDPEGNVWSFGTYAPTP